MSKEEKIHQIALSQVAGIGSVLLKQLMKKFGTAKAVFEQKNTTLCKVSGCSRAIAKNILQKDILKKATALLDYHEKEDVQVLSLWDKKYPKRLKYIYDPPPLIYYQGNADLNSQRVINIVGTRRATKYGKEVVTHLLQGLQPYQAVVVSGLAYGIDIHAHCTALEYELPTVAAVAGGLDMLYPSCHRQTAVTMCEQGGILSEHPLGTPPETYHFPARNRIIAGMSDVTIVVEAPEKSGALITAYCANEYNRDVFAVAGSIYDKNSQGCHQLIKKNQAHLLSNVSDIIKHMGWETTKETRAKQFVIPLEACNAVEKKIFGAMRTLKQVVALDELSYLIQLPLNQLASLVSGMELKGLLQCLPGRKVQLGHLKSASF